MAKNEFLPFGIADGANVLSNDEYGNLAARTNGFSSGVAKSQELNKVWRQASVITSVVAQFIAKTNNQDVLDDGNTEALRAGLLNALRATVGANIPVASQTTAGIAKLSNATNSNSEVDAATPRAVKAAHDLANTANQNAGNAITNANTAIQNADNANNNANARLEKNQNGADIPNKPKFVDNLGLTGTVDLAKNAVPKSAITQHSGNSADHVMSQNTVTNFLNGKFDKSGGQIKTDDKFLSLQNQTTGAANYIEATDSVGNVRYRLGCMHSNSELKIENIAGKTILSVRDSAIYVNGNKVATEPAMEARYASKFRWLHSREIELTKGRYPELLDGEVMTMVRGSVNDAYFEARNARLSFLQCLIDNQWVTAKNA